MNATTARDLIELKKLQKFQNVKEMWCEEQKCDIDIICKMTEDLIVYAISSTSSAQAYEQLQDARHDFYKTLVNLSEKYRHI